MRHPLFGQFWKSGSTLFTSVGATVFIHHYRVSEFLSWTSVECTFCPLRASICGGDRHSCTFQLEPAVAKLAIKKLWGQDMKG